MQQSAPTNKMRLIKWLATVLNVHSQFVHGRSFFFVQVLFVQGEEATLSVSGVPGCLLVKRAHCRARSHPTVKETSKRNFRNALQCPGASSPSLSRTCARQHPRLRLPHIPTCWLCDHSRARTRLRLQIRVEPCDVEITTKA